MTKERFLPSHLIDSPAIIEELRQMPQLIRAASMFDDSVNQGLAAFLFKEGEITDHMCKWMTIDELKPKEDHVTECCIPAGKNIQWKAKRGQISV
ncbi:hypothetical protein M422DRAFT_39903 [Sphaerobolus stellatus SS14]|uniref:Uncharacterized protein n=1 Tax=Sphaerobolus stellatus (strain SS14) TaxID=990650 RepID=A0A0C9UCN9_SPHS4|nr:hypothetical protein M422DRAFT_39903 [Sphaerobolus stellatus SS14]